MDKVRQGAELESLVNNEYFMGAVDDMRQSLVDQEDNLLRDAKLSDKELHTAMKRIAGLRILLTDLVDTLEGIIQEAKNVQYEQDTAFNE